MNENEGVPSLPKREGEAREKADLESITFEDQKKEAESRLQSELINPTVEKYPESDIVRRLRTLKGDVEDALKGGTTVVSVASAASRQRAAERSSLATEREPFPLKNIALMALAALLFLGGAGVLLYTFVFREGPISIEEQVIPLVYSEKQMPLPVEEVDSKTLREKMITLRESSEEKLGSFLHVYLTEQSSLGTFLVPSDNFLKLLEPRAPQELTRSLLPQFMLGLHTFDGNQWFIIFKTNSYEQAFAGMLEFEKEIYRNLGVVLRRERDFAFATTSESLISLTKFRDSVIKNKDVRLITNPKGDVLILYSFVDRETLVITGNVETFGEIVSRLNTPRRVQ